MTKLPDFIYAGTMDAFTAIPNDMLMDPDINFRAKGLLCRLLSNKDGWKTHQSKLQEEGPDGRDSISSALKDLEQNGYLLRIKFRSKKTKRFSGSALAYATEKGNFDTDKIETILDDCGMEIMPEAQEKPQVKRIRTRKRTGRTKPTCGFPATGNPHVININKNNTKKKKSSFGTKKGFLEEFPSHFADSEEFVQSWSEWEEYRKTGIRKKLSIHSVRKQVNMLTQYSISQAIEIIDRSICNGWTGLFHLDKNTSGATRINPPKPGKYANVPTRRM